MAARNHHYVPQCYLKHFAIERGDKTPQTIVFDRTKTKPFQTAIRNIASERDFNLIDADGHPPDAFETIMGTIESELAPALARIVAARSLQNEDDRAWLFNLVGLMAVRTPRVRKTVSAFEERVFKMILQTLTSSPAVWDAHVRKMKSSGVELTEVSYEHIRKFVNDDQFDIVMSGPPVALEMELFDEILPYIFKRRWILFVAPESSGGFITNDHPMCLMWSKPKERGGLFPPGLGMAETQIIFPISNQLAMAGAFELKDDTREASEEMVASINGAVAAHAKRQVYARDLRFHYRFQIQEQLREASSLADDPRFTKAADKG